MKPGGVRLWGVTGGGCVYGTEPQSPCAPRFRASVLFYHVSILTVKVPG